MSNTEEETSFNEIKTAYMYKYLIGERGPRLGGTRVYQKKMDEAIATDHVSINMAPKTIDTTKKLRKKNVL